MRTPVESSGSFSCPLCKHAQRAELVGLRNDFMLQFATCPSCKRRGRLHAFVLRNALLYAGICAVTFVAALRHPALIHARLLLIIDAAVLAIVLAGARGLWRSIDRRVHWLDA